MQEKGMTYKHEKENSTLNVRNLHRFGFLVSLIEKD